MNCQSGISLWNRLIMLLSLCTTFCICIRLVSRISTTDFSFCAPCRIELYRMLSIGFGPIFAVYTLCRSALAVRHTCRRRTSRDTRRRPSTAANCWLSGSSVIAYIGCSTAALSCNVVCVCAYADAFYTVYNENIRYNQLWIQVQTYISTWYIV
jgi:hypothetical protein